MVFLLIINIFLIYECLVKSYLNNVYLLLFEDVYDIIGLYKNNDGLFY